MRKAQADHWATRLGELDKESITVFDGGKTGYVLHVYDGNRLSELKTPADVITYVTRLTGKKEVDTMAKFQVLDEATSNELINRRRGGRGKGNVDLTEYVEFLSGMTLNTAASIEPEEDETARAIKRRLGNAAKLANVGIKVYRQRAGETAIRFSVHEAPATAYSGEGDSAATDSAPAPRGRKAKTGDDNNAVPEQERELVTA